MLSQEEREFLHSQHKSYHYLVFAKAIDALYSSECARLTTAKPEDLSRHQGILQGLNIAKNLFMLGKEPEGKIG